MVTPKTKPERDASAVAPINPTGFTHYASKTSQSARQTSAAFPRAASASCTHQANRLHTPGQQGLLKQRPERPQKTLASGVSYNTRPTRPPKTPDQQGLLNHLANETSGKIHSQEGLLKHRQAQAEGGGGGK
jgi:hypothetical protein